MTSSSDQSEINNATTPNMSSVDEIDSMQKRPQKMGTALLIILFLFISIPLVAYTIKSRQSIGDIRNKAATMCGSKCVGTTSCTVVDQLTSCKIDVEGLIGPPGSCVCAYELDCQLGTTGPYPYCYSPGGAHWGVSPGCCSGGGSPIPTAIPTPGCSNPNGTTHRECVGNTCQTVPNTTSVCDNEDNNTCNTDAQCINPGPTNTPSPTPAIPQVNQSASCTNTAGTAVTISWTAIPGAVRYLITIDDTEITGTFPQPGELQIEVIGTSYTFPSVPGHTYVIGMSAINAAGQYGPSHWITVMCSPPNTPTPTQVIGMCQNIRVYKDKTLLLTDLTKLQPGDSLTFGVMGTNATKARLRINGGTFTETTVASSSGEFIFPYTVPVLSATTTFLMEAELFIGGIWK